MRISIDIVEAVNGYRLDVYDDRDQEKCSKENIELYSDVLLALTNWVHKEMITHQQHFKAGVLE